MGYRLFVLFVLSATILSQLPTSYAQEATGVHDWTMMKSVPPGDELVVNLKNGSTIKGRVRGISGDTLTVVRDKRTRDISRLEVQRIERIIPKSAAKPTLIGAGAGAAIAVTGVVIAAASDDTGGSEGELAAATLGLALIGAGIGALVGLAFGSRQKKVVIYESK